MTPPAQVPENLVALPDAAHRLGLKWERAWMLVLQRELQGVKVGRHWYVERADLERLERERAEELQKE